MPCSAEDPAAARRDALARAAPHAAIAWAALALLLGGGTLGVALLSARHPDLQAALDWQPALARQQPWRAFSAALVHLSMQHLLANLAGAAVVGAFGFVARLPRRAALAWLLAWPLTQWLLWLQPALTHAGSLEPALTHYAGLSGVLHAGVAIAAAELASARRGAERWLGAAVLVGLTIKLLLEAPWRGAMQVVPGWDIAIAPIAHVSGAVAGLACWALLRRRAAAARRTAGR